MGEPKQTPEQLQEKAEILQEKIDKKTEQVGTIVKENPEPKGKVQQAIDDLRKDILELRNEQRKILDLLQTVDDVEPVKTETENEFGFSLPIED